MMANGTDDGAALLRQLAGSPALGELPAALDWLYSDGFVPDYVAFLSAYPPGSAEDRMATLICEYFEILGTLHSNGLCNEDALFERIAIARIWDTIRGYVFGRRHDTATPGLWENFENLATAHKRITREYST